MLGFNWLWLPGWCAGNGKVSDNFGEHPCTVLVSHVDSITHCFSPRLVFGRAEPGTLTLIVYLYDENENGRMWLRSEFVCFRGFRFAGLPNPSTNHATVAVTTQGPAVHGVDFF